MSLLQDIEAKIKNLEAQIESHSGIITKAASAIENLVGQKASAANNLHIINGAIQAYQDIAAGLKSGDVSQAVSGASEAVQSAESAASAVQSAVNG